VDELGKLIDCLSLLSTMLGLDYIDSLVQSLSVFDSPIDLIRDEMDTIKAMMKLVMFIVYWSICQRFMVFCENSVEKFLTSATICGWLSLIFHHTEVLPSNFFNLLKQYNWFTAYPVQLWMTGNRSSVHPVTNHPIVGSPRSSPEQPSSEMVG